MMEMGSVIFWTLYVMAVIAMLAMGVFMLVAVCGKRKYSVKYRFVYTFRHYDYRCKVILFVHLY